MQKKTTILTICNPYYHADNKQRTMGCYSIMLQHSCRLFHPYDPICKDNTPSTPHLLEHELIQLDTFDVKTESKKTQVSPSIQQQHSRKEEGKDALN
jgi:hypothetical protein